MAPKATGPVRQHQTRQDQTTNTSILADLDADDKAFSTLLVVEGAEYAQSWLHRIHAGTAQPGELAVILAFLQDEMLHGACRLIEKALGVHHA